MFFKTVGINLQKTRLCIRLEICKNNLMQYLRPLEIPYFDCLPFSYYKFIKTSKNIKHVLAFTNFRIWDSFRNKEAVRDTSCSFGILNSRNFETIKAISFITTNSAEILHRSTCVLVCKFPLKSIEAFGRSLPASSFIRVQIGTHVRAHFDSKNILLFQNNRGSVKFIMKPLKLAFMTLLV